MKSFKVALATLCAMSVFGFAPTTAHAQSDDIMRHLIPSLEYEQADVREALRALFRTVPGASYTIAPDVQGTITVSLKNVTFQAALENITRQVDSTYRIEGGVINIVRKIVDPGPGNLDIPTIDAPKNTKIVRRIKIRAADPAFIALMIGQKEGSQSYTGAPEWSVLNKPMLGGGGGGMGGGGFGGGGGFRG